MTNTTPKADSQAIPVKGTSKTKAKKDKVARPSPAQPAATKQEQVLTQLRKGTTIAAIMQATGWQQHSVRGFFAGVVRKKLGHNLTSKTTEAGRVYRIGGGKQPKAPKSAKRKAG